jgi:glycosyltransferase involved in cell wall biosynthesis
VAASLAPRHPRTATPSIESRHVAAHGSGAPDRGVSARVLLDATALPARLTGVGRYVVSLIREVAGREEVELHVAVNRRDVDAIEREAPGVRLLPQVVPNRPARILWEQSLLPLLARRLRARVLHGPHYTLPLVTRGPSVVTFHDPTFFTNPELHEHAKVAYFTRMGRVSARRATRVIAVSSYARRGAVRYTGVDPERVDVVYLGVDLDRYSPGGDGSADETIRTALGVRPPYLFWVGTIEPRKDLPTLVEAFAAVVGAGADHRLVLAGQPGWGRDDLESALARCGIDHRVDRLGYVTEEQKVALYRGADAFVYPSVAEGFGLQVVESMASGCPVITTTGSAPEEVGGEAVELVPAREPEALRAAIERVLGDRDRRDALRANGLARAAGFTWARTAEGTVGTYLHAAAG